MAQIIFVQMAENSKIIQSNGFAVTGIQIPFYSSAGSAGVLRRNDFKGRICKPFQLQGKDFQKMHADAFISFCLFVQLLENRVKIKKKIRLFFSAVKNLEIPVVIKRKGNSVHSHSKIT